MKKQLLLCMLAVLGLMGTSVQVNAAWTLKAATSRTDIVDGDYYTISMYISTSSVYYLAGRTTLQAKRSDDMASYYLGYVQLKPDTVNANWLFQLKKSTVKPNYYTLRWCGVKDPAYVRTRGYGQPSGNYELSFTCNEGVASEFDIQQITQSTDCSTAGFDTYFLDRGYNPNATTCRPLRFASAGNPVYRIYTSKSNASFEGTNDQLKLTHVGTQAEVTAKYGESVAAGNTSSKYLPNGYFRIHSIVKSTASNWDGVTKGTSACYGGYWTYQPDSINYNLTGTKYGNFWGSYKLVDTDPSTLFKVKPNDDNISCTLFNLGQNTYVGLPTKCIEAVANTNDSTSKYVFSKILRDGTVEPATDAYTITFPGSFINVREGWSDLVWCNYQNLDANAAWVLEPVTDTTVTITDMGYASAVFDSSVFIPSGITAYYIEGAPADGKISLTQFTGTTLPAGAYILKGAEGNYDFVNLATTSSITTNKLTGSTTATHTVLATESAYAMVKYDGAAVLRKLDTGVEVPKSKAYLPLAAGSSKEYLQFNFDGPTAIGKVQADNMQKTVYYNLQGQKVLNPQAGTIVIANGKKVYITK